MRAHLYLSQAYQSLLSQQDRHLNVMCHGQGLKSSYRAEKASEAVPSLVPMEPGAEWLLCSTWVSHRMLDTQLTGMGFEILLFGFPVLAELLPDMISISRQACTL